MKSCFPEKCIQILLVLLKTRKNICQLGTKNDHQRQNKIIFLAPLADIFLVLSKNNKICIHFLGKQDLIS